MKYFGTDGIRGVYGEGIQEPLAFKTGRAIARLASGRVVVGRDTRVSGPTLLGALVSGLISGGSEVLDIGIVPSPIVSLMTKKLDAAFGIMISASHNPPEYNGIKVFSAGGQKAGSAVESAVEYYIDNLRDGGNSQGSAIPYTAARQQYISHVLSKLSVHLGGLTVLLDCGCGAASSIAEELFFRLGATVKTLCAECRGECINVRCGALFPARMAEECRRIGADIGFAYDGDADRLVTYFGGTLHGDETLYNLSRVVACGGVVVGTELTNSALEGKLAAVGQRLVRTAVGDRNVAELMRSLSGGLGGEPSGHYIIGDSTGDGLLSSALMAALCFEKGIERLELLPQHSVSLAAPPSVLESPHLIAAIAAAKKVTGRVVVRMSGTEPKVRLMAEGESAENALRILSEGVARSL